MAYTLYGSRYIGTGTLPSPVAGFDAVNTGTGVLYVANSISSAWIEIGSIDQVNLGLAALTGFNVGGAITGASGLAPVFEPNFTSAARLEGVDLVTSTQLTAMQTLINTSIASKVSEAIASTSAGITVGAKIAISTGSLHFYSGPSTQPPAQTIPLPIYSPSGVPATQSECKWVPFLSPRLGGTLNIPAGRADGGGNWYTECSVDPYTNRTFAAWGRDEGGNYYPVTIGYWIMAVKA